MGTVKGVALMAGRPLDAPATPEPPVVKLNQAVFILPSPQDVAGAKIERTMTSSTGWGRPTTAAPIRLDRIAVAAPWQGRRRQSPDSCLFRTRRHQLPDQRDCRTQSERVRHTLFLYVVLSLLYY